MSRAKLAQKLGITRMTVWRLENGKTPLREPVLRAIADELDTTPAELLA